MKVLDFNAIQQVSDINEAELRRVVGPDPHRPGTGNARLITEQIPVWAIVGYACSLDDQARVDEVAMQQIARDYDIPEAAVAAALLYYAEHRAAIDARLEANEAPDA